jgi:hypothetical protein
MICWKSKEELINFLNHLCRAWLVLSGTPARSLASILGVLCRKWYPGIVEVSSDVREPANMWDRYALVRDEPYHNKQGRVLAEFWVSLSRTTLLNTSHSLGKSFLKIMNGYIGFVCRSVSGPKKDLRPRRIGRLPHHVGSTSPTCTTRGASRPIETTTHRYFDSPSPRLKQDKLR